MRSNLRLLIVSILSFLILACNVPVSMNKWLPKAEPTVDTTQIFEGAVKTINASIPTLTPIPQATFTPTAKALPTIIPTPAPTEKPKIISKDNIKDLNITDQIGPSRVMDMLFSADGSRLLVLTATQLELFDTADGHPLWQVYTDMVYIQANFTSDGKKILTLANGGGLQEWNASNGEKGERVSDIKSKIGFSVLSASTNRLLTSDYLGTGTLYDTQGLNTVASLGPKNITYVLEDAAINSTGSQVLLFGHHGSPDPLAMMFTDQGWGYYSLASITGQEFGFTFSGNDKRIAAISNQSQGGFLLTQSTLSMWPSDDKNLYFRASIKGTIRQMAISPDGNTIYLVFYNDTRIAVVDVEKARELYLNDLKVNTFSVFEPQWIEGNKYLITTLKTSPDGKKLALCDLAGNIKIRDIPGNKELTTFNLKTAFAPINTIGLGFNGDTHYFIRTTVDRTSIELVDMQKGDVIKTFGQGRDYFYTAISLSPDGSLISAAATAVKDANSGSVYQNLVIWNVQTGNQVFNLPSTHNRLLTQTCLSPDNKTLATISSGQLITWDIKKTKMLSTMGGYSTCEFSADSKRILYDNIDFGVYISEVTTGKMIMVQYAEYITALAFAPNEQSVAVGAWKVDQNGDPTVFYLDTQPPFLKKPQTITNLRTGVRFLAYSPDGKILATLDNFGTLYLNDPQNGAELARFDNLVEPQALTFSKDGTEIQIGSIDGSVYIIEAAPPHAPQNGYTG